MAAGTLEIAFGADLTADPSTWTWTDMSTRMLGSVKVSRGREDESSQTQPTNIELRLSNTDGWLTPRHPSSPWYLQWQVGTPVRVKPPGASVVRQGYVASIAPVWPADNSSYAEVRVTVKGALWRLNQGRALHSALYRTISTASPAPVAYWPVEDGSSTTLAAAGLAGVQPLSTVGTVRFGSAGGPDGSDQLADFTAGGGLRGPVPVSSTTTSWRVEFAAKFTTIPGGNFTAAVQVLSQGGVSLWEIDAANQAGGGLYLQWLKNGSPGSSFSNKAIDDGLWHWFALDVQQSGSDIAWFLYVDNNIYVNGLITSVTLGPVTYVTVNPTGASAEAVAGLGHLVVWAPHLVAVDTRQAFTGWAGETAGARVQRLCSENGVALAISGGIEPMGPQGIGKLVDLLRACEAADHGVLYDGANAGVSYRGRDGRENLSVTMALDAAAGQVKVGFEPIEDDLRTVTTAKVSRVNGSNATYEDPLAATLGEYDSGGSPLNVLTDSVLLDHATWLTHLGTVAEMRAPTLNLQLIDRPELVTPWLAMDVGKRFTVANPPTQYPPGGLDLVLEQFAEQWDATSWTVSLLGSPFAPWRIMVFAADTGDTGEYIGRFETDASALNAGITATATSIAVKVTAGPLWTTASDDFPLDVDIDGEQVRVTAITGASSPQTWTVTRSINGVVKAHNANAPVFLWRAPVVGL